MKLIHSITLWEKLMLSGFSIRLINYTSGCSNERQMTGHTLSFIPSSNFTNSKETFV